MMRPILFLAAVIALAGCQTAEEHDAKINADLDDRLNAYNGATMAEFQARTGMLPDDAYPVDGGRVFVFRTSPVFMTLPATNVTPAVTRSVQCQLLVQTVLADRRGTADSWKIVDTQRSGACRNLPV